jgi:hypothetical protein
MDEVALFATPTAQPPRLHQVRVGDHVVRLGIGNSRVRLLVGPAD